MEGRSMVTLFATGARKRPREDPAMEATPQARARPSPSLGASSAPVEAPVEVATSLEEAEVVGAEDVTFAGLGLAPWVVKACKSMGFRRPTPVQEQCIPSILGGRDVLGCAETGSGKTAAFALPMLHRLSQDPYGIFGLVLTPTRELAIQIAEQFQALGVPINLRIAVVIGGMSMVSIGVSSQPEGFGPLSQGLNRVLRVSCLLHRCSSPWSCPVSLTSSSPRRAV
jgi:ATP-dependent RNA helicase DDX49/DBP8